MINYGYALPLTIGFCLSMPVSGSVKDVSRSNVVWGSNSADARGSMPLSK